MWVMILILMFLLFIKFLWFFYFSKKFPNLYYRDFKTRPSVFLNLLNYFGLRRSPMVIRIFSCGIFKMMESF